jgi:hypothetical protein
MTLWMLWATGVSALLALAALVVEKALRALGREGRWAWVGAIVGATALQVWSLVSQAGWVGPTAVTGRQVNDALVGLPLFIVDGIAVAAVTAPALLERLEPFALAAWHWAARSCRLGSSVDCGALGAPRTSGVATASRTTTCWFPKTSVRR